MKSIKDYKKNVSDACCNYLKYDESCAKISHEAQKYTDGEWAEELTCSYYPGEGICLMWDSNVCQIDTFFEIVKEKGVVTLNDYLKNCI